MVPKTRAKQHPKIPKTTKTNENSSPSSSMHKLVPGSKIGFHLVPKDRFLQTFLVSVLLLCCCLVLFFCYSILTAFQNCVAGPHASTRLGSCSFWAENFGGARGANKKQYSIINGSQPPARKPTISFFPSNAFMAFARSLQTFNRIGDPIAQLVWRWSCQR